MIFRKLDITDTQGVVYLTRWFLFDMFGFKILLHLIHKDDDDRDLHDHPWRFVSILLSGPYTEVTEHEWKNYRRRTFGPGWLCKCSRCGAETTTVSADYKSRCSKIIRFVNARLKAGAPHRLVLHAGKVWTLVFCGRKSRDWGFHTDEGWVHNKKYLDMKFGSGNWTSV